MMKKETTDLPYRLKELGISAYQKAKKGIKDAKETALNTVLDEQLKHRFNLENPYKFVIQADTKKVGVIDELTARHAKRYDEDDLFVFYGKPEKNHFLNDQIIKDLSDNSEYRIKNIIEVTVPVEYNHEIYDCLATAVMCDPL